MMDDFDSSEYNPSIAGQDRWVDKAKRNQNVCLCLLVVSIIPGLFFVLLGNGALDYDEVSSTFANDAPNAKNHWNNIIKYEANFHEKFDDARSQTDDAKMIDGTNNRPNMEEGNNQDNTPPLDQNDQSEPAGSPTHMSHNKENQNQDEPENSQPGQPNNNADDGSDDPEQPNITPANDGDDGNIPSEITRKPDQQVDGQPEQPNNDVEPTLGGGDQGNVAPDQLNDPDQPNNNPADDGDVIDGIAPTEEINDPKQTEDSPSDQSNNNPDTLLDNGNDSNQPEDNSSESQDSTLSLEQPNDFDDVGDLSEWLNTEVTKSDGVKFEVVRQMKHDANAFTQGLTFSNGILYESDGLYGKSSVRKLNPLTGEVEKIIPMDSQYFGEGMVFLNDQLIQITWKSKKGFVYNATDLSLIRNFNYQTTNGEGWGITHNPVRNELIISDGTNKLHFWDPDNLGTTMRTIDVKRHSGEPAKEMNELEFWRGRVIANIWYEDVILVIHPETGHVEKEYDFKDLWPKNLRSRGSDVLNGISVSPDSDILYITGKKWDRIFCVKLLV